MSELTADETLRDQLAEVLHVGICGCIDDPCCWHRDEARDTADAVLSWLLTQGKTEHAVYGVNDRYEPHAYLVPEDHVPASIRNPIVQRQSLLLVSPWTEVTP